MELYLIRHGIAAERGDAHPDDGKRPLTTRGIARFRREVAGLAVLDVTFDQILTSPLVRTRQTADVLSAELPGAPPVATLEALAPGGSIANVVDELGKYARRRRVALVGHEPGIGDLAGRLIGARARLDFKKGAICRIDLEGVPPTKPGILRWFMTPRMLRQIGRGR
jgi:phosphohistidine phosphatase